MAVAASFGSESLDSSRGLRFRVTGPVFVGTARLLHGKAASGQYHGRSAGVAASVRLDPVRELDTRGGRKEEEVVQRLLRWIRAVLHWDWVTENVTKTFHFFLGSFSPFLESRNLRVAPLGVVFC